jgi:branched-chain amino acid transport system permease protein
MDTYVVGQQLLNGLVLGCIYGLIAVGYTMVYGIIGMINFAHGEIYMISTYLAAIGIAVCTLLGIDAVPLALIVTLFASAFITALYAWSIERLAYRPLRNAPRLAPLISAIGVSLFLQSYVQVSQGARNQAVPTLLTGTIRWGDEQHFVQLSIVQILIMVAAILGMWALSYVVKHTSLGRAMRATQQDRGMAEILGINTERVIPLVFVVGAVMAAIAGMLVTLNYGSFDFNVGFIIGIKAFTAAVLGGIGSLPGAMMGGILLGMSESLFSGFVNADYKDVFAFSMLVVFLIFRPSGLLGKPAIEKV